MDELKPCPFCGGEAILEEIPGNPDSNDAYCWAAGCKECDIGWYGDTKEDAIEKWNRRPAPENKPLTLEQLRQMDGEPVYIVYQSIDGIKHGTWAINWNAMKSASNGYLNFKHKNYGKTWLAYNRKPEKEEHHG